MRTSGVLKLLVLVAGCARGGELGDSIGRDTAAAAVALRHEASRGGRALEHVRSLTDEVGPRLAGSPGDAAAVAWGTRTMTALGFSNVRAEPVMVPVWQRGVETAALLGGPAARPLAVTALGGSVATPDGGIEADVVVVPTLEALEALPRAAVEGKIALVAQTTERARDGHGYGKAVRARALAASKAARLGAVAALVRSIGTDDNRLPHTGAMRYEDGAPRIPTGALSAPDADLVTRLASVGATRIRLVLTPKTLPDAPSANVVGEVVGSEHPDEIVLLGAHLDSWDLGDGAIDDGAGCAIVLEAGRQILRFATRPRRTVRVVLFANEENGLAGGKEYGRAHAAELEKHVLAMEADLGAGRTYGMRFLGSDGSRGAFRDLASLVASLGVDGFDEGAEGGADIHELRLAGVPLLDARQDATRYFDFHHTANDTLDKIDRADIDQTAAVIATVAYAAAHTRASFGRVPEDKRKSRW